MAWTRASGFLLEAILTFFLVLVVFGAAVDPRGPFNAVAGPGDRPHDLD